MFTVHIVWCIHVACALITFFFFSSPVAHCHLQGYQVEWLTIDWRKWRDNFPISMCRVCSDCSVCRLNGIDDESTHNNVTVHKMPDDWNYTWWVSASERTLSFIRSFRMTQNYYLLCFMNIFGWKWNGYMYVFIYIYIYVYHCLMLRCVQIMHKRCSCNGNLWWWWWRRWWQLTRRVMIFCAMCASASLYNNTCHCVFDG